MLPTYILLQILKKLHLEDELDAPSSFEGSSGFFNTQNSIVGEDINSDIGDSEASEEGSDIDLDDSDMRNETKEITNNVKIPPERTHLVKFNVDDQRPYFRL